MMMITDLVLMSTQNCSDVVENGAIDVDDLVTNKKSLFGKRELRR
jgi:hypothetical protein